MADTNELSNYLGNIAEAIRKKKGTEGLISAADFDTEIDTISAGTTAKITNTNYLFYYRHRLDYMQELLSLCDKASGCSFMFQWCNSTEVIDMSETDIYQPTTFDSMFSLCSKVREIKFPKNWDTSKVTTMNSMFFSCGQLTSLDFSNFNTSGVKKMSGVFSSCSALKRLDLSNFDTLIVTDYSSMFSSCSALEYLDISNFDIGTSATCKSMFDRCNKLKYIDMRSFTLGNVTNYTDMFLSVPTTCEIIVKSDTEKQWMNNNFPEMTAVKTVSELEDE